MSPELLNLFQSSLLETLWMVGVSAAIGTLFGLPIGVLLVITDDHGLLQHRVFNRILGIIANAVAGVNPLKRQVTMDDARAELNRADTVYPDRLVILGQRIVLEWRDPLGLRGCGFFHVRNDRIVFQRSYFDQLSFFRQQGLPVPDRYLA